MKLSARAIRVCRSSRHALASGLLLALAMAIVPSAQAQDQTIKVGEFLDITGGGASAAEAARSARFVSGLPIFAAAASAARSAFCSAV